MDGEKKATPETDAVSAGRIRWTDFWREFREARFSYAASTSNILDNMMRANENAAAFYEKVILFNGATIVLSLTLLGSLSTHVPNGHLPRSALVHFLFPAWVFFLLSIYCFARRLATHHNLNMSLVQQAAALTSSPHYEILADVLKKASLISSELRSLSGQPIGELFSETARALQQLSADEYLSIPKLVKKGTEESKLTGYLVMVGWLATILGLLLLCIFAIKTILTV